MRVLEPYLRAVEQLLQSFAQPPEVAVEDVDVAWCEAVWDELQQALNNAMLQTVERSRVSEKTPGGCGRGNVRLLFHPHGRS